MCFTRKNRAPFPMEKKEKLTLEDFRGTFENDDGGHRILEKAGMMSVNRALSTQNFPEIVEDEEGIVPEEEFSSPEGSFFGGVAALDGNPLYSIWDCLESNDINVLKINLAAMGIKKSPMDTTEARKYRQARHR